jgi:DNA-binding MarR family transcriptional regulator
MRPVASKQSFVRYPLNRLLGTAANVRLLRILADEVVGPISASEAADRAGLTESGARRALDQLAKTGFVARVGGGRTQQFALREDALNLSLTALFRAERARYDELVASLRRSFEGLSEVRVAWLEVLPEEVWEPLEVALVTDSASLAGVKSEVRRRVIGVEQEFDVTIEVRAFSDADAPPTLWEEVTLLAGVPPFQWTEKRARTAIHDEREQRALRLSEAIAELLEEDPSIVRRAERHLARLLKDEPGAASDDLREWQAILATYSRERLNRFLGSQSPRAQRLRQSSPFFAVLTADERDRVTAALERSR